MLEDKHIQINFTENELYLIQNLVKYEYQYLRELGQEESGMQNEDYNNTSCLLKTILNLPPKST